MAKDGHVAEYDELRNFLSEKLTDYMLPDFFMFMDKLPLTPNGKIDHIALPLPDRTGFAMEKTFVPPRTVVEKVLASIWSEVLGMEKIGVNDNFFNLGGHSLMVFKVFSRIELEFGKKLPPSLLFRSPTIGQLAAFITRNGEKKETAPVIPIRTEGGLPPLFVIAPIGGNVMCYTNLVKYLSDKHPIYGLDSSEEVLNSSIDKAAGSYIKEIRKIVSEGPFYLIGYSSAGNMAFEIARQLASMGLDVPFVGLLDTVYHTQYGKKISWREPHTILHFLKNLPFWFYYYWLHTDDRLSQTKFRLAGILGNKIALAGDDPYVAFQKNAKKVVEWLQHCEKKVYPGRIILFRAKAQVLFTSVSFDKGWNDFSGTLDICEVAGHHAQIVKEPYVRTLAEAINRELGKNLK